MHQKFDIADMEEPILREINAITLDEPFEFQK